MDGNAFSNDLKLQQTIFGKILQRCVPMDGDRKLNFLCGEFLGDLKSLKARVALCTRRDFQDVYILGMCQVSGSGKTRRAFELARSMPVILIRTLEGSIMQDVLVRGKLSFSVSPCICLCRSLSSYVFSFLFTSAGRKLVGRTII